MARRIDEALEEFDLRRASGAIVDAVAEANRYIEETEPWVLARRGSSEELDEILGALVHVCRIIATELGPFLPGLSGLLQRQFAPGPDGRLPAVTQVFPRLSRVI
jgi:methionyl-tRNA synthetase